MNDTNTSGPEPTTKIAEFSRTAAALAILRERYESAVYDVKTTGGMIEAKKARAELRTLRIDLEAKRIDVKSAPLELCRIIDAEAAEIRGKLEALEIPIDAQIKAQEKMKADEKAAREAEEKARLDVIRQRIAALARMPIAAVQFSSAGVQLTIDQLIKQKDDAEGWAASFGDLSSEAAGAFDAAMLMLLDLLEKKQGEEKAAAEVAAERERLAAQAAEQARAERDAKAAREAEEAEAKRVREAADAAAAAERKAADAAALAERKAADAAADAERKRVADAAAAERAEADRVAKEERDRQAEANRQEADRLATERAENERRERERVEREERDRAPPALPVGAAGALRALGEVAALPPGVGLGAGELHPLVSRLIGAVALHVKQVAAQPRRKGTAIDATPPQELTDAWDAIGEELHRQRAALIAILVIASEADDGTPVSSWASVEQIAEEATK